MTLNNSDDSTASIECPFTILPIEGMEFVQNNFVKYKDGDRAAQELVGNDRVTLSKRFKLLERGFSLQLKDPQGRRTMFDDVKCVLECKKPVYAKETKRSGAKRTEQGGKGRTEADKLKKSGAGAPLAQMQNLKISDD